MQSQSEREIQVVGLLFSFVLQQKLDFYFFFLIWKFLKHGKVQLWLWARLD